MIKNLKKVLVTGASRGIGEAIAIRLKEKEFNVLGTSTSKQGVKYLNEKGIKGFQLDLNNKESIKKFLSRLIKEHSDIDILVNNAGLTRDNIVLRMSEDQWMEVINVHLNGTFKISKTVLKFMLKKKWGRIINITSTSASMANRGQSNYSAAKSGVEAFYRSLAKEVGTRFITVNSVAPGYIAVSYTHLTLPTNREV